MDKYILIREKDGAAVYEIFTLSKLCEHLIGLDKGVIYLYSGEFVAAFTETDVKLNRELTSIPDKLIRSLY